MLGPMSKESPKSMMTLLSYIEALLMEHVQLSVLELQYWLLEPHVPHAMESLLASLKQSLQTLEIRTEN